MGRPEVVNSTTNTTPSDHHQQHPGDHMQPPHQMPLESHHQNHDQIQPQTDPHLHQQVPFQQPQTPLNMPTRSPPQPPRHPHAQQQEVVYPPTNPHPSPQATAANPHQPYPPPHPSTPPHHQANPVLHHQAGYVSPQPVQFPPASNGAMNTNNNNNNIHDPHKMYPPNGSPYHYQQNGNGTSTTTGIPLQQQQHHHHQNQTYPNYATTAYGVANRPIGTVGWTTGLFDCMEDPTNAAVTAIFPCLTFGQIAEVIDEGHTTCGTSGIIYGAMGFLIGLPCLLSCTYRTKLRNKYELVEAPAPDWVSHFFCEWCALCQAYRELRNRGLDPSLGWHGNQMRIKSIQQQPQVLMTPPMNQTMG